MNIERLKLIEDIKRIVEKKREEHIKYYDDYRREIGWIDYSNHGYTDNHTVPHWHEVQWSAQYPIGGYQIDHRLEMNTPFGN